MEKRKTQWISVNDELPKTVACANGHEYSEAVIALTTDRRVITAIYNGKCFLGVFIYWNANEEVTHWAPIPLPLPKNNSPYCEDCDAKMEEKVD